MSDHEWRATPRQVPTREELLADRRLAEIVDLHARMHDARDAWLEVKDEYHAAIETAVDDGYYIADIARALDVARPTVSLLLTNIRARRDRDFERTLRGET